MPDCITLKQADNGTWYGDCSVVDDFVFSGETYEVASAKAELHFHTVDEIEDKEPEAIKVNGMCLSCGAIETLLNKQTGTRDFSDIGEHPKYPTGYGCELCA